MTRNHEKLSAFLDGELPEAEAREIENALAQDAVLQAELDALMAAEAVAQDEFARMLDERVPAALVAAIRDAPSGQPANSPSAPMANRWRAVAAAVLIGIGIGGAGGYLAGTSPGTQVAAPRGWLSDIADYHRVYAGQSRHLVEVGADEADHIETWLTASVGAEVRIPDLSDLALTFQGARLLVAAGKPVAQLMFTDADLRVVALCLIQSDAPRDGFAKQTINAFDMVTWGAGDANFVVIGDQGRSDLEDIAQSAASQV